MNFSDFTIDPGLPLDLSQQIADKLGAAIRSGALVAGERLLGDKALARLFGVSHMTVRKAFKVSRVGTIAGCYVTEGKVARNALVRVIRQSVIIYTGKIESMKRFKDDVSEVREGFECGIKIEKYDDIKVDDDIEAFMIEHVARKL